MSARGWSLGCSFLIGHASRGEKPSLSLYQHFYRRGLEAPDLTTLPLKKNYFSSTGWLQPGNAKKIELIFHPLGMGFFRQSNPAAFLFRGRLRESGITQPYHFAENTTFPAPASQEAVTRVEALKATRAREEAFPYVQRVPRKKPEAILPPLALTESSVLNTRVPCNSCCEFGCCLSRVPTANSTPSSVSPSSAS